MAHAIPMDPDQPDGWWVPIDNISFVAPRWHAERGKWEAVMHFRQNVGTTFSAYCGFASKAEAIERCNSWGELMNNRNALDWSG